MWRRKFIQSTTSSISKYLNIPREPTSLTRSSSFFGHTISTWIPNVHSTYCHKPTTSPYLHHYYRSFWKRPTANRNNDKIVKIYKIPGRPSDGYTRFANNNNRNNTPFSNNRTYRINGFLLVATTTGLYIWVSSQQEIPYTGRKHAILLDTSTEHQLGAQTFDQIVTDAKRKGTLLPPRHPASLTVRRVGTRIAAVAGDGVGGGYQDHMKAMHWQFAVIDRPDINAFVVPGGHVVVYTGLLKIMQSEDELAAVLAHEIAHVVARHAAERITQGSIMELLRCIAYWGFGIPIPQGLMAAAFFLPNSRKAETEADVIGIQLAARACYDPASAISVFTKLGEEEKKGIGGGASVPKFLRTHPVSEERISSIKKMLPKAELLGEAAGCRSVRGGVVFQEFEERLHRML